MKRVLAIDMGNTNTKYALFEGAVLSKSWSHPTSDTATAAAAILEQTDAPVALSSVVPQHAETILEWCKQHGRATLLIDSGKQSIISGTEGKLGGDLLAAAVAALHLYGDGGDVLVLGLGTATTITAIAADGSFRGCQFTLGLGGMLETMAARCALLPGVSQDLKEVTLGFDTESAMRNGTLLANVGIAEAWIAKAREQLGSEAIVVVTGGWSGGVAAHTKMFNHVDRELTLKGIRILAETDGFAK